MSTVAANKRLLQQLVPRFTKLIRGCHHKSTFKHEELAFSRQLPRLLKPKPDSSRIKFGEEYTDHMLIVNWTQKSGWNRPLICPLENLSIHPGSKVLHYAIELFEGSKAYRGSDDAIRLFRPELMVERMLRTADRSCLPSFDGKEFLKCLTELLYLEQDWVPDTPNSSLYIRPTMIGTDATLGLGEPKAAMLFIVLCPVSSYFQGNAQAVSLLANPEFVRSCTGGVGGYKMGCNYAPTIKIGQLAQQAGCQQVLWLYGPEEEITEAGSMNIFVLWRNENNEKELITPPLESGLILPGITRRSVFELSKEMGAFKVTERPLTMKQLKKAAQENRLLEMFGTGTACTVCPVERIVYKTKSSNAEEEIFIPTMQQTNALHETLRKLILDIQYGRLDYRGWARSVVEPESTPKLQRNYL